MKYFFSYTLFMNGVLACYFALRLCFIKEKQRFENRVLTIFALASAIWDFGFSGLYLQTSPDAAYIYRSVGMFGVFLYLICGQILVCHIACIPKKWRYIFNGISSTGLIIYYLVIQKGQTVYYPDPAWGMTYHFKSGLPNTLYTVYCIIVSIGIFLVSLHMICKSDVKRTNTFGKRFLLAECFIVLGMVFDTVFPMLGMPAVPGSTMTQAIGMIVIYYAIHEVNRFRINSTNMSEFVYNSLSMPILVYDEHRKLQLINDYAASFLRIPQKRPDTNNTPIPHLFSVSAEDVFDFEETRKDIDAICHRNQMYCNLAVNKIYDTFGDMIGYVIIVTDLSERMKVIHSLEAAKHEAESANRSKSTFLANMSHEIRTPMNAIIGFSELILKMDTAPSVHEYVKDIRVSSQNLLAIINDILDLSKLESGKMELSCSNYYPSRLFQDVCLIIDNQAKKKDLDFTMEIDPEMPDELYGDKVRIRGILINLLNNAVKYTKKGHISLTAKILKKENGIITLEYKISDTGIGIKEDELSRLFDSFSQVDRKTHEDVEGTGLGLAIVKGYLNLMGGTISVDSVYGLGSSFTVVLDQKVITEKPMKCFSMKEVNSARDLGIGNMKFKDTRVLVVDDSMLNLKVTGNTLRCYGISVDTAPSGKDAIELCSNTHYDIVFMDQMMPEMDGTEAMRRIRQLDPHYATGSPCKIIVLTANAIAGTRDQLMKDGFDEYLGKPMNYQQLERLLRRFLPEEKLAPSNADDSSTT